MSLYDMYFKRDPGIGDVATTYGDTAGGIINQAVPGAGTLVSNAFHFISNIFSRNWTGDEKDFVKMYLDATGQTTTVPPTQLEYGHELPEAKVYFSLRFGKKILNKWDALTALGETWSDGLGDRLKANADHNWQNVFIQYGLPVPLPYTHPVGDPANKPPLDYSQVVTAIQNGTFPARDATGYFTPTGSTAQTTGSSQGTGTGSGQPLPPQKGNNTLLYFGLGLLGLMVIKKKH